MNKSNDECFYKLVCIDDSNPLEFRVLVDERVTNLDQIKGIIQRHKEIYFPELVRWMLIPFKKKDMRVREEPT